MKGLLTKDLALFNQRKRTFIFLAVWAVVMTCVMDGSFAIGWMTVIASFFAISSLSYDEYDNCYPFLMSLPVDSKTYVLEKYVFGFLCGMGAWMFSAVVYLIVAAVKGELASMGGELVKLFIFIPIFMLLIDISLPINIKFGSERGRIVILIIWGIVFAGVFLLNKVLKVDLSFADSLHIGPALIGGIILATIGLTVISMVISTKSMMKKEY